MLNTEQQQRAALPSIVVVAAAAAAEVLAHSLTQVRSTIASEAHKSTGTTDVSRDCLSQHPQ